MRPKGFTLIELLIVIAIIAILAAIAVPNFLSAQIRAKIARSLADMKTLGTAAEAFRVDYNLTLVDHWDGNYGIPEYQAAGLGHTFLMDDVGNRSMNMVYNVLTTPIKYITKPPNDPFLRFKTRQECLAYGVEAYICMLVGYFRGLYWYADEDGWHATPDHNIDCLKPGIAEGLGLRPMRKGDWVLLGVGPDNQPENYDNRVRRAIPYDPSNGTVSEGDLMVRSSGEATLGGAK